MSRISISGMHLSLGYILISLIAVNGLVEQGMYQSSRNQRNLETNSATGITGSFPFLMPKVSPQTPDLYLCTPIKVDPTTTYYIVGFNPNATMNTAHHMLLYGCGEPGTTRTTWNCGEMNRASDEDSASPCGPHSNSQIIYAWARDAQKLNLPPGVGFKVGKDSPIKYLVLQVHYAHIGKFKDGSTDDSGVFLDYTEEPRKKLAGTLLLGTDGAIPAMKTEHLETACEINEKKVLHPFAYRVHTHGLGKVVSGYRVRSNSDGVQEWLQLGKRDPLTPQMFYNASSTEPIVEGDTIAVRCTLQSTRNRVTKVGPTNEDEMCNFYLMYYVDHGETLDMKFCFSQGAPYYYWSNPDTGLHNIPHIEASTL
ncbi:peptidylglycine alpha-hydroxylating monooxygenase [Drosophila serrata]|uniref:peptidylglycine alpha-hydroxylating monooxygenase n=1 Tax=Drosophila serrata TaxID=7274 RepID=UPI000A1CFBEF|nr:peptidylglycine alpha-hydroxylating monooxygenase [Drosophila serrata]